MRYHNITKDDMLQGDGLRVVLWVAGCTHHCKGCQNPQTWDVNGGIEFGEAEMEEIREELNKPYVSGLTISGGDPLHPENVRKIYEIVSKIRTEFPKKSIWIYTGFTYEELMQGTFWNDAILECIDVLVDGRYIEEIRDITLPWRGSGNQRVIDVQRTLEEGKVIKWCL